VPVPFPLFLSPRLWPWPLTQMKLLDTTMLVFQYLYYMGREADKRLRLPSAVSKIKVLVVLIMCQTILLGTIYSFGVCVIHGRPFSNTHDIFEVIVLLLVGLFLIYINNRMLGNDDRIQQYKEIFDAWDKKKRLRWTILSTFIGLALLAACFVVLEMSQHGLEFQKWK